MRKYTYLSLTIAFVLAVFTTVTNSSCKKDKCKNVTCSNGGACSDGKCACPTGYSGNTCEALTRDGYTKMYKGDGVDSDGAKYIGVTMMFSAVEDDNTAMKLQLMDENGLIINSFDVKLESNTTFVLESKFDAGNTYTGSGTINTTEASLKINITGNVTLEFNFSNMVAQ